MAFYEPSPRFAQTFCKGWDEFEFPTTDAFFGRNRDIPFDIIMKVFSSLDGRTLAHVRCVAQSWRLLLNQNYAAPMIIARATKDAAEKRKTEQEERERREREEQEEQEKRDYEQEKRDYGYERGYESPNNYEDYDPFSGYGSH